MKKRRFVKKATTLFIAGAVLLTLESLEAQAARSSYQPPKGGLGVRVDQIDASHFPRVEAEVTLSAGEKLDYRMLRKEHMSLIEEEIPLKVFRVEPFHPQLTLALVCDDSGSVDRQMRYIRDAAFSLLKQMRRWDATAVIGAERRVKVLQSLTTDKTLLKRAIGRLRAYGATAVFDGMMLGLDQLQAKDGKRTLLVISDGVDQVYPGGRPLSMSNMRDVINRARKLGCEIYAIGVGPKGDNKLLAKIARETGGRFYCTPSHKHLRPMLLDLVRSFRSRFRITYKSPNPRFTPLERDLVVNVHFDRHRGRGLGVYWLTRRPARTTLSIKRKPKKNLQRCKLRLFTRGLEERFLEMIFYLYDPKGRIVRFGRTTRDGFGRLDGDEAELKELEPATYKLVLRIPGTELSFIHPRVVLAPSITNVMTLDFSRLEFCRLSKPWFDTNHAYGDTSEHVSLRIQDLTNGDVIYVGRLIDFRKGFRDLGVWLQEGVYKVSLDNVWALDKKKGAPHAVLKNKLEAEFQVVGGKVLNFDLAKADLIEREDVLSEEYLRAHAEESPFDTFKPRNEAEFQAKVRRQRKRYLEGTYGKYRPKGFDEDRFYRYLSAAKSDKRIHELLGKFRKAPPKKAKAPDVQKLIAKHHGPRSKTAKKVRTILEDYNNRRGRGGLSPRWPAYRPHDPPPDPPRQSYPQKLEHVRHISRDQIRRISRAIAKRKQKHKRWDDSVERSYKERWRKQAEAEQRKLATDKGLWQVKPGAPGKSDLDGLNQKLRDLKSSLSGGRGRSPEPPAPPPSEGSGADRGERLKTLIDELEKKYGSNP